MLYKLICSSENYTRYWIHFENAISAQHDANFIKLLSKKIIDFILFLSSLLSFFLLKTSILKYNFSITKKKNQLKKVDAILNECARQNDERASGNERNRLIYTYVYFSFTNVSVFFRRCT